MSNYYFRRMTLRRKVALVLSLLWLVFWLFVFPALSQATVLRWPIITVIGAIMFSGFICAAVTVELLRIIIPSWGRMHDSKHFDIVAILTAIFVAIISLGYRQIMSGYW